MVQPLPGLFDDLRINTAIVLPLGIEAYGGYALRTWLSSAVLSDRTRSFARWSAIASLVVGAGAQVASHLMRASNLTSAPPLVTVLVACVPVLVLGLATGLATLVKRDTSAGGEG
jgi:cytochrome bd-type quinol oxidase subunit 2